MQPIALRIARNGLPDACRVRGRTQSDGGSLDGVLADGGDLGIVGEVRIPKTVTSLAGMPSTSCWIATSTVARPQMEKIAVIIQAITSSPSGRRRGIVHARTSRRHLTPHEGLD